MRWWTGPQSSGCAASARPNAGIACDSRTSAFEGIADSSALRSERPAFRGRRHGLVRKPNAGNPHVRFDERSRGNAATARTETPAKRRKPAGNGRSPRVCGRARLPPTLLRPLPEARLAGRIRFRGKRPQAGRREPVQAGGMPLVESGSQRLACRRMLPLVEAAMKY